MGIEDWDGYIYIFFFLRTSWICFSLDGGGYLEFGKQVGDGCCERKTLRRLIETDDLIYIHPK